MGADHVRRAQQRSKKAMRNYSTFKLSIISLFCCILLTVCNILLASGLKSTPTELYLYEHKQLVEDWEALPFIDIKISSDENCPEGFEPLFNKVWNGTRSVCKSETEK